MNARCKMTEWGTSIAWSGSGPARVWLMLLLTGSALVVAGKEGGRAHKLAASEQPPAAEEPVSGDAIIRGRAGSSEIVITTTTRLAGAIHSLTWNGREFIDSHDHGRQLQSASSFDNGRPGPFWSECFNPTEAGSRADGTGPTSTSRLRKLEAEGPDLRTTTQMAFWLAPGEFSSGRAALNSHRLSDHLVSKWVHIGYGKLPHVIAYGVSFEVPPNEPHNYAQFEALTGYMPPDFSRFWRLRQEDGTLEPLSDGPGEQRDPVVLATESGSHAMGIFAPDHSSAGYEPVGYGRFRFAAERVVKWNCVFRIRSKHGIPAGAHRFRMFVAVGTLEDVRRSLFELAEQFRSQD